MIAKTFEKVNNLLKKPHEKRTYKEKTSCKWNYYFILFYAKDSY
jgi:hypothetical protein